MSAYLLLFLQSSPNLSTLDNTEDIASNTLHTNLIGEHVGHAWGVGRVMVWQPSIRADSRAGGSVSSESLRSAGLYKVQGETIQAIMGAIYQQHVGRSVLPYLSLLIFSLGCNCGPQVLPYTTFTPCSRKRRASAGISQGSRIDMWADGWFGWPLTARGAENTKSRDAIELKSPLSLYCEFIHSFVSCLRTHFFSVLMLNINLHRRQLNSEGFSHASAFQFAFVSSILSRYPFFLGWALNLSMSALKTPMKWMQALVQMEVGTKYPELHAHWQQKTTLSSM
jgi:hypothetical protein